jgi:ribosomal protein S12 methylthiotransferase
VKLAKVHIVSLGCPKNRVDSEIMAGLLVKAGRTIVAEPDEADAVIVNTCSFIRDAKEESIDAVLDAAAMKGKTGAKLLVAGCFPQRYKCEIEALFPEVDAFLGTGSFQTVNEVLDGLSGGDPGRKVLVGQRAHFLHDHRTPRMNSCAPYTAFVKVAEGCSNKCSFCAIPAIRGAQESRTIDDIAAEVEGLGKNGVKEFNLIAQDLTAYGMDLKPAVRLHDLVREICTIEPVRWIRLLYCYPRTFPVELMRLIAREEKVCKYVDIPLQHIDDEILRSMKRGRGPEYVKRLIERIRAEIPGVAVRTAFIVGYPGETGEKFEALCDFIEEMEFENAGFFAFSPEEGTAAENLPGQVPDGVKNKRLKRIHGIQRKISRRLSRRFLGKKLEVLLHGPSESSEHLLEGRHRGQAPEVDGVVFINEVSDQLSAISYQLSAFSLQQDHLQPTAYSLRSGDIVTVEVTQAGDYDLAGRVVGTII